MVYNSREHKKKRMIFNIEIPVLLAFKAKFGKRQWSKVLNDLMRQALVNDLMLWENEYNQSILKVVNARNQMDRIKLEKSLKGEILIANI